MHACKWDMYKSIMYSILCIVNTPICRKDIVPSSGSNIKLIERDWLRKFRKDKEETKKKLFIQREQIRRK